MFFRRVFPGSTSRLSIVEHNESYGRHILAKILGSTHVDTALDLGCGNGDDLKIVSKYYPRSKLYGVDSGEWNFADLKSRGIEPIKLDIEKSTLPFTDSSLDLIIANQTLEHTKEIFWINHEIFRTLKIRGRLFIGVPNVLSLHNRILMLLGQHPTQHKLISAHVRPFSKVDTTRFYQTIGGRFLRLAGFWGSQFYPFPGFIARPLSRLFPNLSFSIFFLIEKTADYQDEFIRWPEQAKLETNFFCGEK
jgi:ubiquinone/menaquinone biosynthesis C-methylase UbiE